MRLTIPYICWGFVLLSSFLWGQGYFQGAVLQDTRWSGVIIITGDVTVEAGVRLTIDPGTILRMLPGKDGMSAGKDPQHIEITVKGQLIAGSATDPREVTFTSDARAPRGYDWYGIILTNSRTPSQLHNCIVEYGLRGLTCMGNPAVVENSVFQYHQYAGIVCELRSRASIRNCSLLSNEYAGIVCELAAAPSIENCVITQNLNGVANFDTSVPDLGGGNDAARRSAGGNMIFDNRAFNIINHASTPIYARHNIWKSSDAAIISTTFSDGRDKVGLGMVLFEPVFQSPRAASAAAVDVPPRQAEAPREMLTVGNLAQRSTAEPPPPNGVADR